MTPPVIAHAPPPSQPVRPAETRPAEAVRVPSTVARDHLDLGGTRAAGAPIVGTLTEAQLRAMIASVGVGVTIPNGTTLATSSFGDLKIEADTRIDVRLDGRQLIISASPGFVLDPVVGPDIRLQRLTYNIETGEVDATAVGPGPNSLYSAGARWAVKNYVVPLLPAELRDHSYDPRVDPELATRLSRIVSSLGGSPGAGSSAPSVTDVAGNLTLTTDRELRIPAMDDLTLIVPAHTTLYLRVETSGSFEDPRITSLSVRTGGHEVELRKTEGTFASLHGIAIRSVHIAPGGQITADFDPLPEQAANGGVALLRLLGGLAAISSGDGRMAGELLNGPAPNIRMDGIRRDVQTTIDRDLEPLLRDFLTTNDGAIPGYSLARLASLDGHQPAEPAFHNRPRRDDEEGGIPVIPLAILGLVAGVWARRRAKAKAAAEAAKDTPRAATPTPKGREPKV